MQFSFPPCMSHATPISSTLIRWGVQNEVPQCAYFSSILLLPSSWVQIHSAAHCEHLQCVVLPQCKKLTQRKQQAKSQSGILQCVCFLVANIKPTDCETSVSYYSSDLLCACSYDLLVLFSNIGLCHMSERLVICCPVVILSYILWPNMLLVLLSSQHGAIFRFQMEKADRECSCSCLEQAVSDSRQGVYISFGVMWGTNSFSPQKVSMWSVFHRAPEFIGFFEKTEEMGNGHVFVFSISSKELFYKYCIRHNMYLIGPSNGNSRLFWVSNMDYKMD